MEVWALKLRFYPSTGQQKNIPDIYKEYNNGITYLVLITPK